MGSYDGYSVPWQARKVFEDEILKNPLTPTLPSGFNEFAQQVKFDGQHKPSIPINWRFAESVAALKAFEATMLNYLVAQKYGSRPAKVHIDTDHASLFIMSPAFSQIVGDDGQPKPIDVLDTKTQKLFPNNDIHRANTSLHRTLVTNIYKTKDGRFYHSHGSMNPGPALEALGEAADIEIDDTYESAVKRHQEVVSAWNSNDLDKRMNDDCRQAGTIAWTTEEYLASDHAKANAHVGLYTIEQSPGQQASWWPENQYRKSSPKAPLAGLKVVDLCRVIAGPTITRGLAEMGASIMRITSPNIADISILHQDMNWGKWNCHLDLKNEADNQKLRDLILDADVVVDGYRPGVMERLGFGRQAIFELVKDRPRGIIHARENCYGWNGPWSHRSGWQQISDACCGVSLEYGRAMGIEEAVTPVFPNSDFCTGIVGSAAVLHALIQRADKGGSYGCDVALNYYSQWLIKSVGTYPNDVWCELWERHGSPVFRHYHAMQYTVPALLKLLYQHDKTALFKPSFFEQRRSGILDTTFQQVKPIAQFPNGEIELKYHVGTRGNGRDQPYWPADLSVEVVT